ncbi:MAG: peptide transporter [Steroidobacteraceae bacterium]
MINLEEFEHLAYTRQRAAAVQQLLQLLRGIDANSGLLGPGFVASSQSALAGAAVDEHLTARITAAITVLATDPGFTLSGEEYLALLEYHGWLGALFAASRFGNADHVLRALSPNGATSRNLQIPGRNLPAFCLFYGAESEIPLDFEGLWVQQRRLAAGLCVSLLAAPFLGTPVAWAKQELLLKWLPARLAELEDLDFLPAAVLYRACMRSSYADFAGKHAIKRPINALIRSKLRARGLLDTSARCEAVAAGHKPTVLVVVEWLNEGHSIYRTHSLAIAGLRSRFRVVGLGYPEVVDAAGRAVFDEFRALSPALGVLKNLEQIRETAAELRAQILYMPSVCMSTLTLFLSNLRVAPCTVIGLGHPATTHSPVIDRVAVEEDLVGDPACFSESLMRLPADGQPYRPPQALRAWRPPVRSESDTVQIAVVATGMKLNPRFLAACAQVVGSSATPVHLHFLVGNAAGLTAVPIARLIERYLGDRATFHPRQPYADYLRLVASCDLFLNAFPFGNTNGIVDTVAAGLVGVCRSGPEVHEHIDEGLFRRLRFPDWLITRTDVEYVAAACRLVDDGAERRRLSQQLAGAAAVEKLFSGRAEALAERLHAWCLEHGHRSEAPS